MKQFAALAVLALVCACDSPPPLPLIASAPFSVDVHFEDKASDLQDVASTFGQNAEVDGFTIMTLRGGIEYRCEIHIVRPRDLSTSTQELLGHEFAHCLYGAWHP